jgi:small subunit ribosomal protein S6
MATQYELLYIIPATVVETEVGGVETKISNLITKYGASVQLTKRLGKLHLAYQIKKQRYGYYVAVVFTAEPSSVAKIEENLRISNDILRHLITSSDKSVEEQKFDLVQFVEVNVEEERARRREKAEDKGEGKDKEDGKEESKDEKAKDSDKAGSAEDLDKKIDAAAEGDQKTA